MKYWIAAALLLCTAISAHAEPHVWLDTDAGPILLKLDAERAPITTAHFRTIVGEGFYDGLIFHRTFPNFMIQGGRFDGAAAARTRAGTVPSERNNGLLNTPGKIAIALPSVNNQTQVNSGTTEFFINTTTNAHLDADFTAFGEVVFGMANVVAIGERLSNAQTGQPFRPALIRRAVNADGFPIMNLHTGAWYDPANSGRGFSVEIGHAAGGEDAGPLLIVYWYDYFEGRQVWMNGAMPFAYGATEVTLPLQITSGGEFGADFDPEAVESDPEFGSLTVRFPACDRGLFSYQTKFGSGELELQRLTIPGGDRCG
jgi:peptidyl-prolyl cis-trans isomerase A (cyclophilin A)